MSQFAFLRREWADVFDASARRELRVHRDARASWFYAHRALELAVAWAFEHDAYESPFTDLTPRGPDGLFSSSQVDDLIEILGAVKASAPAA